MNKIIEIKVEDKVASLVDRSQFVVCGNTDYEIHFEFSEEWSDEFVKTALFVFGEDVVEKVFTGNVCEGVEIVNASLCRIGVYAGNIKTTTPACLNCRKSITDAAGGKVHTDPSEDIYNQIIEVVNQGFAKIEDFEEDIDGLLADVDGLKRNVTTQGNSINNLQMDVSDINAQLGGIRDDISQNSQGIKDINQIIGWMSGDIGANSFAIGQNSQKISQNTKDIAEQTKRNDITDIRLANLEHHINLDYFYTDESVAYQKVVPANAAPYAQLNSVGGMTYKSKNLVDIPNMGDDTIMPVTISVNFTSNIYISAEIDEQPTTNAWIIQLVHRSGAQQYLYPSHLTRAGGNKYTITADDPITSLTYRKNSATDGKYSKFMVSYGDTRTPYEPYYDGLRDTKVTAVRVLGADGTERARRELPASITSLDGWGKGIEGYPNTYDFESGIYTKYTDDGESLLETPITENIPVAFDNIIAVEGGGSLEFVNEYSKPAPSSITYLLQEGSV